MPKRCSSLKKHLKGDIFIQNNSYLTKSLNHSLLIKTVHLIFILLLHSFIQGQSPVTPSISQEMNNADSALFYLKECVHQGKLDTTTFEKGMDFLYITVADEHTYDQFIDVSNELIGIEDDKYYNTFLHGLFYAHLLSTEYERAISMGKSMITKFENSRKPSERDYFLIALASLRQPYRVSYKLKEGFNFYTDKLEMYLQKGDSMAISTCYMVLGGFYGTKGLYDLSVYHTHKSISYIPMKNVDTTLTYNSYQRLINNTGVLGHRYIQTGNYHKAIEFSKLAISHSNRYKKYAYGQSFMNTNIAHALLLLHDYDSVIHYLNLSLLKSKDEFEPEYDACSYLVRGMYYFEQNALDSSEKYLYKCIDIMDQYSLLANVFTGTLNPGYYLAQIRIKQNRFKEAEAFINQEIPKLTNLRTELMNEYKLLIDIYFRLGNMEKSKEAFAQFSDIQDELTADEKTNMALSFETEQKINHAENTIIELTNDKKIAKISRNYLIGIAFLLLTAALILFNRFRITHKQKILIEHEQRRSEELLLNILPSEVAEELKQKGSAEAKQFDDVTVMFTDFKGFTKISEKLSPSELVAEIDTCFKAFDQIIDKHNIEKIKTIGDAYMCAGGLPVLNKTHATDIIKAALEIQQFMVNHFRERVALGLDVFEIRIGIHTGPVVAGIVGVKKFAYDIWGDTVNTASRMESSGQVGKINISGNTYEIIKDQFHCVYRGKIEAKGKGEIDMYFVENSK